MVGMAVEHGNFPDRKTGTVPTQQVVVFLDSHRNAYFCEFVAQGCKPVAFLVAEIGNAAQLERYACKGRGNSQRRNHVGSIGHIGLQTAEQVGCSRQPGAFGGKFGDHTQALEQRGGQTVALQGFFTKAWQGDPSGGKSGDFVPECRRTPVALHIGIDNPIAAGRNRHTIGVDFGRHTGGCHHAGCHLQIGRGAASARSGYAQRRLHKWRSQH